MAGSTSIVPARVQDKITFYENHIDPWTTNATAIGTTTTAVTDLQTKTTAARDAFNAQKSAQDAAKAATLTMQLAVDAMAQAGAEIISAIRTKAKNTGDSVYTLAQIPAPATPSPVPPPGRPFDFNVDLDATGMIKLTWKCNNPTGSAGTIYQVWRQIGEAGTLEYLGGSGRKEFVDGTVPAGSPQVTYQIQAVRSTAVGDFATFLVKFGVSSGGGATIASVTEGTPAKMAA